MMEAHVWVQKGPEEGIRANQGVQDIWNVS